jgi:hypothetical protein
MGGRRTLINTPRAAITIINHRVVIRGSRMAWRSIGGTVVVVGGFQGTPGRRARVDDPEAGEIRAGGRQGSRGVTIIGTENPDKLRDRERTSRHR